MHVAANDGTSLLPGFLRQVRLFVRQWRAMRSPISRDAVIVSDASFRSDDPSENVAR